MNINKLGGVRNMKKANNCKMQSMCSCMMVMSRMCNEMMETDRMCYSIMCESEQCYAF